MRAAYLLVLLPALAQGSEVQFDFTTLVDPLFPVTWNGPGPAPTTFEYTFLVDSLSATSVNYVFGTPPSSMAPCLVHVAYGGLAATNINAYANGVAVFHASSGTFGIGGDNATNGCPGRFFAAEGLQTGSSIFACLNHVNHRGDVAQGSKVGVHQDKLYSGARTLLNSARLSSRWASVSQTIPFS
jgi:hypothetical protein